MATKYYPQNTNADTTCDWPVGTAYDLSKTAGTPTTHTIDTSSITSWTVAFTYNTIVTGDSPSGTGYDFSISLNSVSNSDVRIRVLEIPVGCSPVAASGYSTTWTTAGTKTGTLTMSGAWSTGTRLELHVEVQRNLNHGTRQVVVDVQSSNTWVQGNDYATPGAGNVRGVI